MGLCSLACLSLAAAVVATGRANDAILPDPRMARDDTPKPFIAGPEAPPADWPVVTVTGGSTHAEEGSNISVLAESATSSANLSNPEQITGATVVLPSTQQTAAPESPAAAQGASAAQQQAATAGSNDDVSVQGATVADATAAAAQPAAASSTATAAAVGQAVPGRGAKKKLKWTTTKIADPRIRIQDDGFHGRRFMAGACHARRNSEMLGEELVAGDQLILNSTGECCEACRHYKPVPESDGAPCNVWNFCDGSQPYCNRGACSLHYLPRPWEFPITSGPDVPTVSGIAVPRPERPASTVDPGADRRYHVVVSAQGRPVHWQSRINYYHYRKVKQACSKQATCHMGGYTRLLHSGQADDLMYEIPTYVVDKLPGGMEDPEYLALNRPYAFMQWSKQAVIPEKYVFMMEPDHVWVRPMPNLMINDRPMAWPFWYIQSAMTHQLEIVRKYVGPLNRSEIENKIAPTGSSPMLMTMEDLKKTAPLWLSYGSLIHSDPKALEVFGFMHEMNAFVFGMYHAGIHDVDLDPMMMSQPPYGPTHLQPFYILHYTYAWEYNEQGPEAFYRFDKRYHYEHPPLANLTAPPKGVRNEQIWFLYNAFKEAMGAMPNWDEYAQQNAVQGLWEGVLASDAQQVAMA